MRTIEVLPALDDLLSHERAIVYKHSPRCELCDTTYAEVEKFAENFPAAPVYLVDVIGDRHLSDRLEEHLGVRHESPQVILVEHGEAARSASHRGVRFETLETWWRPTSPDT